MNKNFLAMVAVGLLAGPMAANANLIVNGGFEDNPVPLAVGSIGLFSSASVGWEGDNIEIWNQFGGVVAPEGVHHIELNSHPDDGSVFSIYQNFATVVGQTYDVSFFYSARVDSNEQFSFSVGDVAALLNDHVVGSWTQYTGSFVANSVLSTITFTTFDTGTVGNFLDGVCVDVASSTCSATSVPEPGTLAFFGLGLVGLGFARRRRATN